VSKRGKTTGRSTSSARVRVPRATLGAMCRSREARREVSVRFRGSRARASVVRGAPDAVTVRMRQLSDFGSRFNAGTRLAAIS